MIFGNVVNYDKSCHNLIHNHVVYVKKRGTFFKLSRCVWLPFNILTVRHLIQECTYSYFQDYSCQKILIIQAFIYILFLFGTLNYDSGLIHFGFYDI